MQNLNGGIRRGDEIGSLTDIITGDSTEMLAEAGPAIPKPITGGKLLATDIIIGTI